VSGPVADADTSAHSKLPLLREGHGIHLPFSDWMRHVELQRPRAGRVKQMRRKMTVRRKKAILERNDFFDVDGLLRHAQLLKLRDRLLLLKWRKIEPELWAPIIEKAGIVPNGETLDHLPAKSAGLAVHRVFAVKQIPNSAADDDKQNNEDDQALARFPEAAMQVCFFHS
jgi:hypothetical protein